MTLAPIKERVTDFSATRSVGLVDEVLAGMMKATESFTASVVASYCPASTTNERVHRRLYRSSLTVLDI